MYRHYTELLPLNQENRATILWEYLSVLSQRITPPKESHLYEEREEDSNVRTHPWYSAPPVA